MFIGQYFRSPKVHKLGVPLRPIVSFYTSTTFNLSKCLVKVLSWWHVCNSKEFVSFIRQECLDPDEVLVSFDVVSLFTKIPIIFALGTYGLPTFRIWWTKLHQPYDCWHHLFTVLMSECHLLFFLWYYLSTGLLLARLFSVVVANLVMEHVEEKALATFPREVHF